MTGRPIDGTTRLYGVLGHPVSHSLSPAMHNAAFGHLGINAAYVAFPVAPARLPQAIAGLWALGVAGWNLTVPHKESILPLLNTVLPAAQALGAVNTVRVEEDGSLTGTNTDGEGFLRSLDKDLGWNPAGRKALVLGAGGSARAVAAALLAGGVAELILANRTLERAEELAALCRGLAPQAKIDPLPLDQLEGLAPHLLVNTTTVGMGESHLAPVALERVGVTQAVLDIVYSPPVTPLLAAAQRLGLAHANGLGMLLYQGALAFTFWTGQPAPEDVMRKALLEAMARKG
ncbi:MAG: shikimate dehydrogenase [Deltaproteobacteria bacterium]|nr:shikimate dehydrogenase [Deltaproteobacteria bacterium]